MCNIEWDRKHLRMLEDGLYCPFCYADATFQRKPIQREGFKTDSYF